MPKRISAYVIVVVYREDAPRWDIHSRSHGDSAFISSEMTFVSRMQILESAEIGRVLQSLTFWQLEVVRQAAVSFHQMTDAVVQMRSILWWRKHCILHDRFDLRLQGQSLGLGSFTEPRLNGFVDMNGQGRHNRDDSRTEKCGAQIPMGYGFSWNSCPAVPKRSKRPCKRLSRPVYQ